MKILRQKPFQSLVVVTFYLLLAACQKASYFSVLQVNKLKANNLEEILSQQDEILMTYSLNTFDKNGQWISTANGAWGVAKVKKGESFGPEKFKKISIEVPPKGKVVASVVLIEVENYEKAKKVMRALSLANNLSKLPALLLQVGEQATPLRYLSWAITATSVGIETLDFFDTDDVLGSHQYEILASKGSQTLHFPLVFRGKHLNESYEYEVAYGVIVKY